jgi:PEGA domain
MSRPRHLAAMLCLLLVSGCVTRLMTIKSDPPGALLFMNGQEVGRTPVTQEFLWYGNYGVILRLDGYETLKTSAAVPAPVWQYIPLDLITDMLPLTDEHVLNYTLKPASPPDPADLLSNAQETRAMLESSQLPHPKPPATQRAATTKPTTKKSK